MERTHHGRPSTTLLQPTSTGKDPRSPRRGRRMPAKSRFALIVGTALLTAVGVLAGVLFVTGSVHTLNARSASSTSSVPLFGSSVGYESLAQTTAQFGRMPIVRVYYRGLPAFNAWDGGLAGANHSAVIVSFKALPTDILSGADDAALTHFFDTAPTGHPIYYSYYHEPEDNIADGQFTLADYKAAWARVVALADAARNPDLHSTLILMNWDLVKALRPGLEVLPARWRHHQHARLGRLSGGQRDERQPAAHPAGRFHGPVHHGVRERRAALRIPGIRPVHGDRPAGLDDGGRQLPDDQRRPVRHGVQRLSAVSDAAADRPGLAGRLERLRGEVRPGPVEPRPGAILARADGHCDAKQPAQGDGQCVPFPDQLGAGQRGPAH